MPDDGSARRGLQVRLSQREPIPLDTEFAVGAGEVMALIGPSGSGKSTTLRSIAGLYRPADGRIACNGSVWLDHDAGVFVPARQRRVGLVFQSYALFPHLTAIENVMEAMLDVPAAERREQAHALLRRVHLDSVIERRPAALSGGEQQRVAVARALGRRPEVLLLDEPFSAVDRVTRRALRRELADLRRDLPMPVVLVTHDLDDAARLADRLCVLHKGRVLQTGPVGEVMNQPATPEVASLLDLADEAD